MRKKLKAKCPVCALPSQVREQLAEAPKKKIRLEDRLEWLQALGHKDVHIEDLTRHLNTRHDYNA